MIPKKRSGRIWLSDFYLIVGSIKSKNPKTRVIVGTFYVHALIIDFNRALGIVFTAWAKLTGAYNVTNGDDDCGLVPRKGTMPCSSIP
jgi:hypothetical protein